MSEDEAPKKARFRLPPEVARGRRARRGVGVSRGPSSAASPVALPAAQGPAGAQPPSPAAASTADEQLRPCGAEEDPANTPSAATPEGAEQHPATDPATAGEAEHPATTPSAATPEGAEQHPATGPATAGAEEHPATTPSAATPEGAAQHPAHSPATAGEAEVPAPRRDVQDGLQALWAEHASSGRRLLSGGVLTELRLRASFDPFLIKRSRVRLKVLPGGLPDCQACEQPCCVGLENTVSLRLVDIARLIDLGRQDLIQRDKPRFPPALLRRRPALGALVESELWQRLPVMRQRGPRHICAALTPDLRCSLYPHWPTSCERFPYFLRDNRREVAWGRSCPHKRVDPTREARSEALFQAAIDAYNERVKDAVLLAHAPAALDALGIGAWIDPA